MALQAEPEGAQAADAIAVQAGAARQIQVAEAAEVEPDAVGQAPYGDLWSMGLWSTWSL